MSNHDTSRTIAIGFIAAAAVGLAVGILYASHSGKELRLKIADMFDDMAARIDKFGHPEKYSRIKP